MADEDKTVEELAEDTDADTRDVDEEVAESEESEAGVEKEDEEQVVEDTDADTRDIASLIDGLYDKVDTIADIVNKKFDSISEVLLASGATVTENTQETIEPAEESEYETLTDLDYTLED